MVGKHGLCVCVCVLFGVAGESTQTDLVHESRRAVPGETDAGRAKEAPAQNTQTDRR